MLNQLETIAESARIRTSAGNLAGVLTYPADVPPLGKIVMAGPHPLLGGAMDNNVVREVANDMASRGWITLRFDYLGVGNSEGPRMLAAESFDAFWEESEAPGESERWQDLASCCAFIETIGPQKIPLVVLGYSFGNFVVSNWLSQNGQADALVAITPTIERHDLTGLATTPIAKLVIVSDSDFATSSQVMERELPSWKNGVIEHATDRDGHFFRGHESWLCDQIEQFLCNDSLLSAQHKEMAKR